MSQDSPGLGEPALGGEESALVRQEGGAGISGHLGSCAFFFFFSWEILSPGAVWSLPGLHPGQPERFTMRVCGPLSGMGWVMVKIQKDLGKWAWDFWISCCCLPWPSWPLVPFPSPGTTPHRNDSWCPWRTLPYPLHALSLWILTTHPLPQYLCLFMGLNLLRHDASQS